MTLFRNPTHALFFLLLVVALATPSPQAVGAQDADCTVVREDGTERDCAFMEEWGECLYYAYESYGDCIEMTEDEGAVVRFLWGAGCTLAHAVDNFVCTVETPFVRISD